VVVVVVVDKQDWQPPQEVQAQALRGFQFMAQEQYQSQRPLTVVEVVAGVVSGSTVVVKVVSVSVDVSVTVLKDVLVPVLLVDTVLVTV